MSGKVIWMKKFVVVDKKGTEQCQRLQLMLFSEKCKKQKKRSSPFANDTAKEVQDSWVNANWSEGFLNTIVHQVLLKHHNTVLPLHVCDSKNETERMPPLEDIDDPEVKCLQG